MSEPTLTFADVEAAFAELWAEIGESSARTLVMRHDTYEMVRDAYRAGVKRRRKQRGVMARSGLLNRGSAVRERESMFERFERRYGREHGQRGRERMRYA